MNDLNKHDLIRGIIHDLGDENAGIQVRGYRNCNILRTIVEALTALADKIKADDEAHEAQVRALEGKIESLEAELTRCRETAEVSEAAHDD